MTSVLSSYAQIAGRSKFFVVLDLDEGDDITGYVVNSLRTVTTLDPAASSANRDDTVDVPAGSLLKDLGAQIVVYSSTLPGSPHTAVYRQVIRVNGQLSEGVPDDAVPFYVRVFSADGTGVSVVRTG